MQFSKLCCFLQRRGDPYDWNTRYASDGWAGEADAVCPQRLHVGALALAGIPILNGFWSKELILETGLQGGPTWAFWFMAAGAGLTGLYTLRMVGMVFFGEAYKEQHVHDATMNMRIALGLLGAGTLSSWMLIGPFSQILTRSAFLVKYKG